MNASETILVVDPDPAVLHDVSLILEPHGYRLLTARHGREAIRKFETSKIPVNLLLTAVMMPGLSGFDVAGSLTQWNGRLGVIFMSEYNRETLFAEKADDGRYFVRKPITGEALLQKVRDALVERRRPAVSAASPATASALTA
jgi:CheY-like chemotaxis protein